MESQLPIAYQNGPPPFTAATVTSQKMAMDLDFEDERRNRAASVLSGMSQEDMEAAETLNSLQARKICGLHSRKAYIDPVRLSSSYTTAPSETHSVPDNIFAGRPARTALFSPHVAVSSDSFHDQSVPICVQRNTVSHTWRLHSRTKCWFTTCKYAWKSHRRRGWDQMGTAAEKEGQ